MINWEKDLVRKMMVYADEQDCAKCLNNESEKFEDFFQTAAGK